MMSFVCLLVFRPERVSTAGRDSGRVGAVLPDHGAQLLVSNVVRRSSSSASAA